MRSEARQVEERREDALGDDVGVAEDWNVQLLGMLPRDEGGPMAPTRAGPAHAPGPRAAPGR